MTALAPMLLTSRSGEPLVLEGVSACGQLHDALLTMAIEQRYRNPGKKHIEAVYTFPLPWGAVLMAVEVDVDGKSLRGQVHARPQAEARYEDALSEGDAAILLERNRDGSHTLNLGNLAPGEPCCIRIRYAQSMTVEQGSVRLVLPTVIAPRYGDPHAAGLQPQQVPKVDWLAQYPLQVTVDIFGSLAAARVASPSHPISMELLPAVPGACGAAPAAGVRVSLSRPAWLDRDVVLLLGPLAHDSLGQALADPFTAGQTAVKLALKPCVPARSTPLRLKILVDCSGSMQGDSMAAAREALQAIVHQLDAPERFSLSRFGSTFEHRSHTLWAVTPATRQGAQRWIRQLEADLGGTEMEAALASTFALYAGTGTRADTQAGHADVLLVTDGQIHSVPDTVARARASGHRVFVVGIGSAANDQLIFQLAQATGGACEFVVPREAVVPAVLRMFHRLRGGHVSALHLHWPSGLTPVWQQTLPHSVFDGDTVHIHAQFAAPVSGALTLVGRLASDSAPIELATLTLPPSTDTADPGERPAAQARTLARMVAWAHIQSWAPTSTATKPKAQARQRIADIAVAYQLVTSESSFVLTHQRAEADKALEMPEQRRIRQMLAAGWAGSSSVHLRMNDDTHFSRVPPRSTRAQSPLAGTRSVVAPSSSSFLSAPVKRPASAAPPSGTPLLQVLSMASTGPWSRAASGSGFDDIDADLNDDLAWDAQPPRPTLDRSDARLWSDDPAYTGLTPLGLAQWLDQTPTEQWPTDIDGLVAIGVGQAVIDWIELVLAVHWHTVAQDSVLLLLLVWIRGAEVRASLTATLHSDAPPVPLSGFLASALTGITARAWPAQVFALEDMPELVLK